MGFRSDPYVLVMGPRLNRIGGGKTLLLTDHKKAQDARGNDVS